MKQSIFTRIALIVAVSALSSCAAYNDDSYAYQSHGYGNFYANPLCQFTVFEGITLDRKNQIKVCMKSRLGQNYMEFHYDTQGQLAQRSLEVRAEKVMLEETSHKNNSYVRLSVNENHSRIAVTRIIEHGIVSGKITVNFDGKEKTYILDPRTIVLNGSFKGHRLLDYGVTWSPNNTDIFKSSRVLAPE